MQQACLAIESKGYVVIDNEILVYEYVTEWNMAPPGVRKLNQQALELVIRVLNIQKNLIMTG